MLKKHLNYYINRDEFAYKIFAKNSINSYTKNSLLLLGVFKYY